MKAKKDRNHRLTIIVVILGLAVLAFIFNSPFLLIIGVLIGGFSLLSKQFAENFVKIWFMLAEFLGRINGAILLSVIFYGFLLPIALLQKLFVKSTTFTKKSNSSLYVERNKTFTTDDLKNPW